MFAIIIIWGTMTLVIFYTNALSPYCPGGAPKKRCPLAATILKNFFSILKIIFFDSYQNLFRFLSKSFSILITEDGVLRNTQYM